jgi:hypothetical protein
MRWNFVQRDDSPTHAERFRREHSAFLTRALLGGPRYPTIPTRRVADGGFDALTRTPAGRARASRWWAAIFWRMDRIERMGRR